MFVLQVRRKICPKLCNSCLRLKSFLKTILSQEIEIFALFPHSPTLESINLPLFNLRCLVLSLVARPLSLSYLSVISLGKTFFLSSHVPLVVLMYRQNGCFEPKADLLFNYSKVLSIPPKSREAGDENALDGAIFSHLLRTFDNTLHKYCHRESKLNCKSCLFIKVRDGIRLTIQTESFKKIVIFLIGLRE